MFWNCEFVSSIRFWLCFRFVFFLNVWKTLNADWLFKFVEKSFFKNVIRLTSTTDQLTIEKKFHYQMNLSESRSFIKHLFTEYSFQQKNMKKFDIDWMKNKMNQIENKIKCKINSSIERNFFCKLKLWQKINHEHELINECFEQLQFKRKFIAFQHDFRKFWHVFSFRHVTWNN